MKTIVIEHFNGILFHKSGLANKQHTNHYSAMDTNEDETLQAAREKLDMNLLNIRRTMNIKDVAAVAKHGEWIKLDLM